ncbi:MAG: hypothetical protein M1829_002722 [Trizodia sp. TS-e1964]|nr:MAG: hypothetical protein M1829_002722 [Trizodia sp. TS-e1964]
MPWQALPRIAFAVAIYPFQPSSPVDLPLEIGDELYIIEQGGINGSWYRGYLVAPPSLLAGLTSVKGQTLEARVFSGIFPQNCVEIRELLGESGNLDSKNENEDDSADFRGIVDISQPGYYGTFGGSSSAEGKSKATLTNGYKHPTAGSNDDSKKRRSLSDPFKRPISSKGSMIHRDSSLKRGASHRSARSQRLQRSMPHPMASLSSAGPRDPTAPKPPAPVPMLKVGDETPTSAQEPLVDEIASCLREWHSTNLHELLLGRRYSLLDKMSDLVRQLDLARRQFLHGVLTNYELNLLREKTVWDLVRGNKMFGGEVVVRDPAARGRVLTSDDSAVEVTKLQSMMSLLDTRPTQQAEVLSLHHLLLDVKSFAVHGEPFTLEFFLCAKSPGSAAIPLTETLSVDMHSLIGPNQVSDKKTLFTDLSSSDIGEGRTRESELYLVVRVVSKQTVSAGGPSMANARDMGATANSSASASSPGTGRRSVMWGQKSYANSYWGRSTQPAQTVTSTARAENSLDSSRSKAPMAPLLEDSEKLSISRFVGTGVLRLSQIMLQEKDAEYTIKIWAPSAVDSTQGDGAEKWDDFLEEITSSRSRKYSLFRLADRLKIQLRPFKHPDASVLIKKTPTLLQNISCTNKIGFSGAPTKPRSDIYLELSEAFLPRQALLSHPKSGSIPLPHNMSFSQLHVALEVRQSNGEKVEQAILASSNSAAATNWLSMAVERGESWKQTIKLEIAPEMVTSCHVFITLMDAPGHIVAFSWMPLWDQEAFLRDGHHSLLLYKYEESPVSHSLSNGAYLVLPWSSRAKDDVSKDEAVTGPIATVRVRSYLCSTKFSQDKVLLGLLKWRESPSSSLTDLLKRVVFVPEIEIVKLLDEVFDALFGILVENAGNDELEDLIFNDLVVVLGIVHDRRFNLGPLVDQYAELRFNYPFATPCLVRSFTRLLSNPTDSESSRKLRATFKVGRHILKFIINAREQQKVKEAGIGITSTHPGFARDLITIFKSLEALMRNPAPILVGSQTLAVQHFHTWLSDLYGLLSTDEILNIAVDFMDSCVDVKGKLILYKLVLIINYSRLDLFSHPETRRALNTNTVRWLAPYWGETSDVTEQWRDQVRLCCSVLSTQVNELGQEISEYVPKVISSYRAIQAAGQSPKEAFSMLFPVTYPFPSKAVQGKPVFEESLIELSAVLAAVSSLPTFINTNMDNSELAEFLFNTLQVHMSILSCEAFPNTWLSVHIFHHKSTMNTLEYLAGMLVDSFLPHPDDAESFNAELWRAFFTTVLKLVGSDALALETFPEQKRRAVWKIAGDVREHGADLLRRTWEAIGWETSSDDRRRFGLEKMGGYQVQYVPGLVSPIVELCLSVHEGLRSVAVEVLQTMIVSEWTLSQDLSVIQAEMIDCLDQLFKSKRLTESILQKLFIAELTELFQPLSSQPDDPLYMAFKELIATTDEFLDLLVAVHSSDLAGEASHIMHTLRLMEFLRDMQKEDIFIRYVHQLAKIQNEARNPVEAGLALGLHAELYPWDPLKTVEPMLDPSFPEQSAFERKEQLYFEIIKCHEEGKSWENALAAYKELALQYENNVFDLSKLARTQRAMAKIYEAIGRGDRHAPRYFRVVYRGLGFPVGLRDKQFIFEGSPSERLSAFTDRIQQGHPAAQIINAGDKDDVEGQYLQISAVSPLRNLLHPVYQRPKIPHPTREYLLSVQPNQFTVTSRRRGSNLDIKEQFVDKVLYTTAESFPTILRRSEIVKAEQLRLSPLQSALERTVRKTQDLVSLEQSISDGNDSVLPSLVEAINISIDPATHRASVAWYRDFLPARDADESDDGSCEVLEFGSLENALKTALLDHAMVLKRCLGLISKRDDPQLTAVHSEMSSKKLLAEFEESFEPELASLAPPHHPTTNPLPWLSPSPLLLEFTSPLTPEKAEAPIHSIGLTDHHPNEQRPRETRHEKNRLSLSFLKRQPAESSSSHRTNGVPKSSGPDDETSSQTTSRSRSKSTRRSFLEREPEPHTPQSSRNNSISAEASRRSTSSNRPKTSQSNVNSIGSRVGSVRRRLSLLKIGKKNSKVSVKVDSDLVEE